MTHKRIGILTSGGDCPGLNAVVRAVVKSSMLKGWDVFGIPYGTDGFMDVAEGRYAPDDLLLTKHGYNLPGMLKGLDVLQFLSGSVLGSLSTGRAEDPDVVTKILKGYAMMDLAALIVVGGDGSLDIVYDLAQQGNWNIVAVPKTIDNDVPFTEWAVGFTTAVDIVTQALYDLTFTAASHERVMIVQVMGRDAGHLALNAGIAGGADILLIPEIIPDLTPEVVQGCCSYLAKLRSSGRQFALVVISEGIKNQDHHHEQYIADVLAKLLKSECEVLCDTNEKNACYLKQMDIRTTILGHLQRSSPPLSLDRLLATVYGIKAVELIEQEDYDRVVVWRNGNVQSIPIKPIIKIIKKCHKANLCSNPVDPNGFMVKTARSLGIYLGHPDDQFLVPTPYTHAIPITT